MGRISQWYFANANAARNAAPGYSIQVFIWMCLSTWAHYRASMPRTHPRLILHKIGTHKDTLIHVQEDV